ncbi:MAG: 3',5'-cyclic-AMP phosphodiesterase [Gammaproteobacteria bacterium]|nr:3',5'-cyclic-AMP phosphodiesterase [Gammaproteobacteria bacterium]
MSNPHLEQSEATLRLVQFTDPHLFADRRGEMRGVNTYDSLNKVLDAARRDHWTPDAVLVTGDIAQDESRAGYRVFRELFDPLSLPVLCLPGNHDDPKFMREELKDPFIVTRDVMFDSWCLPLLSTYVRGTAAGEISRDSLKRLAAALSANEEKHVLICLHHQPVPVGSKWLDGVGLRNPEDLFSVIDKFENVRGILWGHVHQEFDAERKGVRLMASPSTCRQFLPDSDQFALDDGPPGYRWLRLGPDGKIETGVVYVDD